LSKLAIVLIDALVLKLNFVVILSWTVVLWYIFGFDVFAGEELILILITSEFVSVGRIMFSVMLSIHGILVKFKIFS